MSIHAQMTKAFYEEPESLAVKLLIDILQNNINTYQIPQHQLNRRGEANAELVGGNLSIIYSHQATPFEIDTDGKILFIEDLNEYLYHLDRIMINLKLSGKLKNLKGLVVGAFTDMKDNPNPFGKTPYEIISEHVAEYDYPVCFDFPAGHISNNIPLIIGMKYNLSVESDDVALVPII
jgi:muramoyltetrapeptide carboxypeptidase